MQTFNIFFFKKRKLTILNRINNLISLIITMAPNLPLALPAQETLISPLTIVRDENSHGTHRVVSTYVKGEVSPSYYMEPDAASKQDSQLNSELRGPTQNSQQTQEQQDEKAQELAEVLQEDKSKNIQKIQEHIQMEPVQSNTTTHEQQPKSAKLLMRSTSDALGTNSEEDADGDETSSDEKVTKFLNFRDDSHEVGFDVETFSVLRQREVLSTVRPSGLERENTSVQKNSIATFKNSPGTTPKEVLNSKTENESAFTYKSEFHSSPDLQDSLDSQKADDHISITTYKPSKRHSFYLNNNNENINSYSTEPSDANRSRGPDSHSKHPVNDLRPDTPTESTIIMEDIVIKDGTKEGSIHLQEELADFSNLFHHQKSIDELAIPNKDVNVRGDNWLLQSEGSTAVVLVGMCFLILLLICAIYVVKKFHRHVRGKTKTELVDAEGKTFHKSHFPDLHRPHLPHLPNLPHLPHIPEHLVPHLPFVHTLTHNPVSQQDLCSPSVTSLEEIVTESQLGRLWFTVRYDDEKSDLRVNILHAKYPNGRGISSNAGELWVEGKILSPMNTVKAINRSSSRKATYSPVFNHCFLFLLKKEEVNSLILKLRLHDKHPKRGESIVGSIILPLSSVDLDSSEILCRDLV